MTADAFTSLLAAASAAREGESIDKDALAVMLAGPDPRAAVRMAVNDFVGAIENLVDVTGNGLDTFVPQVQTGASCKCVLSPDYGHPPVQSMALLMFATASYGVRMNRGDELPLDIFVADVLDRVHACTRVIMEMNRGEST